MSKELTDAWKAGKLKCGYFFLKLINEHVTIGFYDSISFSCCCDFGIKEVISPCDYDIWAHLETKAEWQAERIKELEKKLKIAVKALKEYANRKKWKDIELYEMYYFAAQFKSRGYEIAEKALNEFN